MHARGGGEGAAGDALDGTVGGELEHRGVQARPGTLPAGVRWAGIRLDRCHALIVRRNRCGQEYAELVNRQLSDKCRMRDQSSPTRPREGNPS
ncbi:hypothetical protein GCM10009766_22690 [Microcella frigidaquae]